MKRKASKKPQVQSPTQLRPIFMPNQHLGTGGPVIVTDSGGGVWRIDPESGQARMVEFRA